MRTAESVVLTPCPPWPPARYTSTRSSSSRICTSTSSALGKTLTVAADVWMRPCASVSGTRWTRCPPTSHFRREYTSRPCSSKMTSLIPPSSVSLVFRTSTFQFLSSAYFKYMRIRSAAHRLASWPPSAPRISRMASRAALGSRGLRYVCKLARTASTCGSIASTSCWARARISSSAPSSSSSSASPSCPTSERYRSYCSTTGASSLCSRPSSAARLESPNVAGSDNSVDNASTRSRASSSRLSADSLSRVTPASQQCDQLVCAHALLLATVAQVLDLDPVAVQRVVADHDGVVRPGPVGCAKLLA